MKFSKLYLPLVMVFATVSAEEKPKTKTKESAQKIAFIDFQRILPTADDASGLNRGSKEWQDLMKKMSDQVKPIDEELMGLEEPYIKGKKDFEKLRAEYESLQRSGVSSAKVLQEKQDELRKRAEELGKLEYQANAKMQKRQEIMTRELRKAQEILAPKLDGVVEDLRIEEGYDLVLRKEAIVASSRSLDLTDQVLEVLNQQYIEEQKAKKAKKDVAAATGKEKQANKPTAG